jgi:tetratricopeptide (TPR) repeat protein
MGAAAETATMLNNVAYIHMKTGNLLEAKKLLDEALPITRSRKLRGVQCLVLNTLGGLLRYMGDLATAEKHLNESLALARTLQDQEMQTSDFYELAQVAILKGNLMEAETLFRTYTSRSRETGSELPGQEQAVAGTLKLELGDPTEALALFQQALAAAVAKKAVEQELDYRTSIVRCLLALGRPAEAEKGLSTAIMLQLLRSPSYEIKLNAQILQARIQGYRAPDMGLERLKALEADARTRGYLVYAMECALGQVDVLTHKGRAGEVKALKTKLRSEAEQHGLALMVRKLQAKG